MGARNNESRGNILGSLFMLEKNVILDTRKGQSSEENDSTAQRGVQGSSENTESNETPESSEGE